MVILKRKTISKTFSEAHETTVKVTRPRIILTFDDGPHIPGTEIVLSALEGTGIKAAFFLNATKIPEAAKLSLSPPGEEVEREKDSPYTPHDYKTPVKGTEALRARIRALLKYMRRNEHIIANHGLDHDPTALSSYQRLPTTEPVRQDFESNAPEIAKRLDEPGFSFTHPLARLPGDGRTQARFVDMLTKELKLHHVGWHAEFGYGRASTSKDLTKDWLDLKISAGKYYATYAAPPNKDLNIFLLHDEHWRHPQSETYLKKIISSLARVGTVLNPAECLGLTDPQIKHPA